MRFKKYTYFSADFETTVYEGQDHTEVWAAASVEFNTEDVHVFHSINDLFWYYVKYPGNVCTFFHNLKFDGSFWLPFLIQELNYKQAYHDEIGADGKLTIRWDDEMNMRNGTFRYTISDRGQWYMIQIKVANKFIEIRDSLKLLPFSVKEIGKAFKTKHQKLEMEYEGYRYAGCEITDEEKKYIANDVLVVKEALEIMFQQGHSAPTVGSCCFKEFKRRYCKDEFNELFPNMYDIKLDKTVYGVDNAGDYIRKSYKGGWCYLVPEKAGKELTNGCTFDVNSLYPSMMHSSSGNEFPVGKPFFWSGNYVHEYAQREGTYFFVRIKTRFYLKPGMLPTIQIKNSFLYIGNEWLTTSDVWDGGKYNEYVVDSNGNLQSTEVTLTLTKTDYYLMIEHYELVDFEILDGCVFYTQTGLFDQYIDKYAEIKKASKGAMRTLAKLFLNNLYGQLAKSTDSSFKIAYIKENGVVGFKAIKAKDKTPGYIPIGSAITSYARNFTIRAAQKNYNPNGEGFCYADTDSIHCDTEWHNITGITINDRDFNCWKHESDWDVATFTRQKTYIEHVTHENGIPVEELKDEDGNYRKPYYDIKGAGVPPKSKKQLQEGLGTTYQLTDYKPGIKLHGRLSPKRIKGGIVLIEGDYEMR